MTAEAPGEHEGATPGGGLRTANMLRGAREKASQFSGGRSHAVFASQMREGLYRPSGDMAGEHLEPMDSTPSSYAYRHALQGAEDDDGEPSSVYDRLTNPQGYTGTHRHRFGRDGRGRGI